MFDQNWQHLDQNVAICISSLSQSLLGWTEALSKGNHEELYKEERGSLCQFSGGVKKGPFSQSTEILEKEKIPSTLSSIFDAVCIIELLSYPSKAEVN